MELGQWDTVVASSLDPIVLDWTTSIYMFCLPYENRNLQNFVCFPTFIRFKIRNSSFRIWKNGMESSGCSIQCSLHKLANIIQRETGASLLTNERCNPWSYLHAKSFHFTPFSLSRSCRMHLAMFRPNLHWQCHRLRYTWLKWQHWMLYELIGQSGKSKDSSKITDACASLRQIATVIIIRLSKKTELNLASLHTTFRVGYQSVLGPKLCHISGLALAKNIEGAMYSDDDVTLKGMGGG